MLSILHDAGGRLRVCDLGGRLCWTPEMRSTLGRTSHFIESWPEVLGRSPQEVWIEGHWTVASAEELVARRRKASTGAPPAVDEYDGKTRRVSEQTSDTNCSVVVDEDSDATTASFSSAEPEKRETSPTVAAMNEDSASCCETFPAPSVSWADLMSDDEVCNPKGVRSNAGDETIDGSDTHDSIWSDDDEDRVSCAGPRPGLRGQETESYWVHGAGHIWANGTYVKTSSICGGFPVYQKRIRGMQRPWQPFYLYCWPLDGAWYIATSPGGIGEAGCHDLYRFDNHPAAGAVGAAGVALAEDAAPAPRALCRTVHLVSH
mmetsp:Transcript_26050/g.67116  ORF Transcript_26050/g.67116 Transcript_26050/m.67116 type:complete len:318 (-) Transcript_26050:115-1068(-)